MLWFLLWCEEDTSFSLVTSTAVLYEDPVNVGDSVKFFYGSKESLGIIRGMDEDYDALKIKQDEFNLSNKQKADSFHEGMPRRAATESRPKMSDMVKILRPGSSKEHAENLSSNKRSGKEHTAEKLLNKRNKSSKIRPERPISALDSANKAALTSRKRSGEGIYTSSDSGDARLTAEEQALLAKIRAKKSRQKAKQDVRMLKKQNHEMAATVGNLDDMFPEGQVARNTVLEENSIPANVDRSETLTVNPKDTTSDVTNKFHNEAESSGTAAPKGPDPGNESSDSSGHEVEPQTKKPRPSKIPLIPFDGIMYMHDDLKEFTDDEQKKLMFKELKGPKDAGTGIYVKKNVLLMLGNIQRRPKHTLENY